MDAHDAVVKIDGSADVVRDDRDAVTHAKSSGIFSEAEHAMLFPQAHDARRRIRREIAKAVSWLLWPIGRERLAPGINDGAVVDGSADHGGSSEERDLLGAHRTLCDDVRAAE